LVSAPKPSRYGQEVTLTATVAPSTATGAVAFYDGVTVLGSGPLSNGQAQLATPLLASGARTIHAFYPGDANNSPAPSNMLTQTVNPVGGGGFLSAVNYATGSQPGFIAAADLNHDGIDDLVVANGGGVSIHIGNGDGTFKSVASYTP
jgi:hypothetical protein